MKKRSVAIAAVLLLAACTQRQVYDASQGWRQNECDQIADADRREDCLRQAQKSYEEYQRQREDTRQP